MPKLHEILAVEGDLSATSQKVIKEATVTFTKKADHFMAQSRTLKMFDAGREGEEISEEKAMVTTVMDKLRYVASTAARFYDAKLQKEATNQMATADLVVDGMTIGVNIPATYLLGMERELVTVRDMLTTIPTLQPGIAWSEDISAGAGHFKAGPSTSMKTEKTTKSKVLYEATKEHPAQIDTWKEDVPIGKFETMAFSSMLTSYEKSQILARTDKLIRAVKKARQRANDVEIQDRTIGAALFSYILG